jgi:hypothetical protein
MVLIDGFAPTFCVRSPLLPIYELRPRKPDVPGQHVARLEHVTRSQVENIHDELVEVIDEVIICLSDRADLDVNICNPPGFLVNSKVGTLKQFGLTSPNWKDRLPGS